MSVQQEEALKQALAVIGDVRANPGFVRRARQLYHLAQSAGFTGDYIHFLEAMFSLAISPDDIMHLV